MQALVEVAHHLGRRGGGEGTAYGSGALDDPPGPGLNPGVERLAGEREGGFDPSAGKMAADEVPYGQRALLRVADGQRGRDSLEVLQPIGCPLRGPSPGDSLS
ncbi:hypothetical protein [Streptomyces sp. PanSC19]|uniref:hypothetical protein n=1 Tax=Streptomyces sp. PanSC19 TaxID=1520455 RepID=UPI00161FB8F2|nr:hypothetical protein [Streptomyces sp. PanSC19]